MMHLPYLQPFDSCRADTERLAFPFTTLTFDSLNAATELTAERSTQ